MRIQLFVLTAMLISPMVAMAAMADRYHHDNHIHSFRHTHRRYYRPTHRQVLVSRSYTSSGGSCSSSSTTAGGLLGGGLAAALSKKDAYGWSVPLGAVLGMGIANADC